MTLLSIQLSKLVLAGVARAQKEGVLPSFELPELIHLTRPNRREWGDYSSALPLQLAKQIDHSPIVVANHIQDYLPKSPIIEHSTVSEPGFLNVTLSSDWLCSQVARVIGEGTSFMDLDQFMLTQHTSDAEEGMAAFFEKREPKWKSGKDKF